MTKNITLRMDENLLKEIKHIAVEEDLSVSAWITRLARLTISKNARYEESKIFAIEAMEKAGDYGGKTYSRDELHER